MGRGRPKGLPKTGGRPPGGLNKTTQEHKAILDAVFAQLGGVPRMLEWATESEEHLSMFYTALWIKTLPKEIKLSGAITLEAALAEAAKRIEGDDATLIPLKEVKPESLPAPIPERERTA